MPKGATKADHDGQVYMTQTDTPLSEVADGFIQARARLTGAKDQAEATEKDLIKEMKGAQLNSIMHKGEKLTIKSGHVTKESIMIGRR